MITKIKRLINWFRHLIYIVDNYEENQRAINDELRSSWLEINAAVKLIKERTNIHADIGYSMGSHSQIITIGRYRNRDYVQVFSIDTEGDFRGLIEQLREMERYGVVRRVDCPLELNAVIDRELVL